MARIQCKYTKTTIIQTYAPTEDAEYTEKDEFYDQPKEVLMDTPNHNMVLLIGDMNAQINGDYKDPGSVIGPYGSGSRLTDNGERMQLLCGMNSLCIGNTYFPHKNIH